MITSGEEPDPGPIIKEDFGSNWVFTDARECEDFIAKLLESGWAETVHEDGEAFILKIRDEKGEPPPVESAKPTEDEEDELNADEDAENNDSDNANIPEDDDIDDIDDDPDEDLDDEELPPDDEGPIEDEEPVDKKKTT
jgi:hypothetical protein